MDIFLGPLVQSRCGEGGTLRTNSTGMCSQCLSHTAPVCPPCPHCSGSRLLRQEPSEAGPGLYALPRSKPFRFRHSGSPQRRRLWLGLCFVPFPGLSSSGDQVFGEHSRCNLSLPPSLPLGFLGVQPAHLLKWMLTVQNPKKSWLATKPACSLVDDAVSGAAIAPFRLWLPVTRGAWSSAG